MPEAKSVSRSRLELASKEGVVFADYTFVFNCTGARP
jgi:hypothetical protein